MSKQQCRGGMGSHKHGVSGRNRTHPLVAADVCRENNRQRIKRFQKESRDTVQQVFADYHKERHRTK